MEIRDYDVTMLIYHVWSDEKFFINTLHFMQRDLLIFGDSKLFVKECFRYGNCTETTKRFAGSQLRIPLFCSFKHSSSSSLKLWPKSIYDF